MGGPKFTFLEVYERCFGSVWAYVASQGLAGAEREDVVQEVFLAVHQRLHTFEGRSNIKTWVIGIALNVIRTHRRRRATRKLGEDLDQFPEFPEERSLASEHVESEQDAKFLFEVLERLSDPQREIFTLIELQELSVVQAAELLETNEETLRSRLRAARKFVNAAIQRRGGGSPAR